MNRTWLTLVFVLAACNRDASPNSGGRADMTIAFAYDALATPADSTAVPPPGDLSMDACGDGGRDNQKTDVDCGGPDCKPCDDGLTCKVNRDCLHKNS